MVSQVVENQTRVSKISILIACKLTYSEEICIYCTKRQRRDIKNRAFSEFKVNFQGLLSTESSHKLSTSSADTTATPIHPRYLQWVCLIFHTNSSCYDNDFILSIFFFFSPGVTNFMEKLFPLITRDLVGTLLLQDASPSEFVVQ